MPMHKRNYSVYTVPYIHKFVPAIIGLIYNICIGFNMILYTYPNNFRAYKALIAAEYSGVNVKVSPDFVFGVTNKTSDFFEKFRTNNVPVLETADGKHLSESNAIAYFLSNQQLRGGNDIFQQSKVQQWISFADNYIVPGSCSWVFPLLGILPLNKNNTAKADCISFLNILDKKLFGSTFLVGERITLADIVVFCSLLQLYQHVLEPNIRGQFTNVNRWFKTILNQDQVHRVIGSFILCEKGLVYDPKKFSEQTKANPTKGAATRKQENEKKPKLSDPKNDDDDEETPAQPETNPFDNMPKGLFGLDDFKRCYSNEDESVSIAYFWEKFDAEHYSIWFGEYKYNEELSKVFMSCNLITGMFQRLDKMRKQTFASVCLFGEDNSSSISGVWVWRGQDLAFKLSPDWQIDYDCYEWKKLDPSLEETRKIVSQYFSWTGADNKGRKFNQGKIFK